MFNWLNEKRSFFIWMEELQVTTGMHGQSDPTESSSQFRPAESLLVYPAYGGKDALNRDIFWVRLSEPLDLDRAISDVSLPMHFDKPSLKGH